MTHGGWIAGAVIPLLAATCFNNTGLAQTGTVAVGHVIPLGLNVSGLDSTAFTVGGSPAIPVRSPSGWSGLLIPDAGEGVREVRRNGNTITTIRIQGAVPAWSYFEVARGGRPVHLGTYSAGASGRRRVSAIPDPVVPDPLKSFRLLDSAGVESGSGSLNPVLASPPEWHGEAGSMGMSDSPTERLLLSIPAVRVRGTKVRFGNYDALPVSAPPLRVESAAAAVYRGQQDGKYDVVIVGDGFRARDRQLFHHKADQVIARLKIFAPYASQFRAFNFWRLSIVSNETGITNQQRGVNRDTALGLSIDRDVERRIVIPSESQAMISQTISSLGLRPDVIVILSNDYYPAGVRDGDYIASTISGEMPTIITHELGHRIGELEDEYDCYVCDPVKPEPAVFHGEKCGMNVTRDQISCNFGISPEKLFPGAWYVKKHAWRTEDQCHMRNRNSPFCKVCSRVIEAALEPMAN